jgi:hypothetical protein
MKEDTFVDLEPTVISQRNVCAPLDYDALIVLPFDHANLALDLLRPVAKCGTNTARCDYVVESLDSELVIFSTRFSYIVEIIAQAADLAQIEIVEARRIAQLEKLNR